MNAFLFALLISQAHAAPVQSPREEIITFNVSMLQQSCRRPRATEPYVCSSEMPNIQRVTLVLQPVAPSPMEEQAFEGSTPEFGVNMPGSGEYMPWVSVRKSVAMEGESVIYVLRFRTQLVAAQIQQPTVYETVHISAENLRLSEPLVIMGDRYAPNDKFFKQIFFTLVPTVQFAKLVEME